MKTLILLSLIVLSVFCGPAQDDSKATSDPELRQYFQEQLITLRSVNQRVADILSSQENFNKEFDNLMISFDQDENGELNVHEFQQLVSNFAQQAGEQPPSIEQVHDIIQQLEWNGQQGLQAEELRIGFRWYLVNTLLQTSKGIAWAEVFTGVHQLSPLPQDEESAAFVLEEVGTNIYESYQLMSYLKTLVLYEDALYFEVQNLAALADTDNSQTLDYDEARNFTNAVADMMGVPQPDEQEFSAGFQQIAGLVNDDGVIDEDELNIAIGQLAVPILVNAVNEQYRRIQWYQAEIDALQQSGLIDISRSNPDPWWQGFHDGVDAAHADAGYDQQGQATNTTAAFVQTSMKKEQLKELKKDFKLKFSKFLQRDSNKQNFENAQKSKSKAQQIKENTKKRANMRSSYKGFKSNNSAYIQQHYRTNSKSPLNFEQKQSFKSLFQKKY